MTFACIFPGFAESRPWECRVFSFKMHVRHKCLVFFRSLSICSCSLRLCKALRDSGMVWKALEGFGMVWKALEGSAGFARFCMALGGFEGLRKALGRLVRF